MLTVPLPAPACPLLRRLTFAVLGLHLLLLALSLPDYRVTIDSGYHVSLARLYAEHLTAWWDPINWGPAGRPNLQGPAMHVAIGVLGRVLGGSGDAYVLANSVLALAQWLAASLTVQFFARRLAGDRAAFFAVVLFTGSGPSSLSFAVGLPSGWIFILTAWAVWFFVQERRVLAVLCTSAACYVHLGGFATAPVGVLLAALLLRRWRALLVVGLAVALLTLPYVLHFLRYRAWYIGERGHVGSDFGPLLIYLCALPALLLRLRHPVRNALLIAWAFAPTAWLFQDPSRLVLQWALTGAVLTGLVLDDLAGRLARPALRRTLLAGVTMLTLLFPLTVPALAIEGLWLVGLKYPRMEEWDEAKSLAEVIHGARLDDRLVYVYNHSFAPALAVWYPMSFERGHWVEVQPRPNPANQLPAGGKTYVMPLAPDDPLLARFAQEGLLVVHGGTQKSAVLTLSGPGQLEHVAQLVAETLPPEARWLADHAVNNTLDPTDELFSEAGLAARRARLREQRFHAGRIAVCALVYAQALEPRDAQAAEGSRSSVRGYSSIAAFLSDEWAMDFQNEDRHARMRENFRALGDAAAQLGQRVLPFEELDQATDRLFDEYFWAA